MKTLYSYICLKSLNAELNPICHLLALLEGHHIFHVSGLRVNSLHLCMSNSADTFSVTLSLHFHDFSWWWSFKTDPELWYFWLIQQFCSRFRYSEMLQHVNWKIITDSLKYYSAYIRLVTFFPDDRWQNILVQINWQIWNCNKGFKV
jgi:hypothetical protein